MEQNDKIQLFEDKRIRTAWDEEKEEWYFSIVDVCEAVRAGQPDNPTHVTIGVNLKQKTESLKAQLNCTKKSSAVENELLQDGKHND